MQKSASRIHAYGTIDELNAYLGLILSDTKLPEPIRSELSEIQSLLFRAGADLATRLGGKAIVPRIEATHAQTVERWIDALDKELPPLTKFIYPSGSELGAKLHFARTICRRAERWIAKLEEEELTNPLVLVYMNRLSDYLFIAARWVNKELGIGERTVELRT